MGRSMSALRQEAIEAGLIDEREHEQLLADINGVLRQAGIPQEYVWTSIREFCSDEEIDFVASLKKDDCPIGMVYMGEFNKPAVNERMMAITGACLRNYINAKVMTVQDVLGALKTGSMPSPTVLLIPNFFMGKGSGGHIADWEKSDLLGLLYKRHQEGKKTVIYVSDKKDLAKEYGKPFVDHIHGKYVPITN